MSRYQVMVPSIAIVMQGMYEFFIDDISLNFNKYLR